MKPYKNLKRKTGSQSETPTVVIERSPELKIRVGGYQLFTVTPNNVEPKRYGPKFRYIKDFLRANADECDTIADLGCSTGLVCFMALMNDYKNIYALDHDVQCLDVIDKVCAELDTDRIVTKPYSFGDDFPKVDIVVACALIHWIYSCTALNGNFDTIFEYLRERTEKILVIEWVDPRDPAIKFFNHTGFNTDVIVEDYTVVNFRKSLEKYFTQVEKVLHVTSTRHLYLARV